MKIIPLIFLLLALECPAINVLGSQFPNDGKTRTYLTPDGLVSFTTMNFFLADKDFVADGGGDGQHARSFNQGESLEIQVDETVGLTGFSLRWTRARMVIFGLKKNPDATLTTPTGVLPEACVYDFRSKTLTIDIPWDFGFGHRVTFGDLTASMGTVLDINFTSDLQDHAATFVQFSYEKPSGAPPPPIAHYSLNKGDVEGALVKDLTGHGNHARSLRRGAYPSVSVGRRAVGESYLFRGATSGKGLIRGGPGIIPGGSRARTITLWMKQTGLSGQNKIFGQGIDTTDQSFDLSIEDGMLCLRHGAGNYLYGSSSSFINERPGWHHIAIRVNQGARTFADVELFVDGTLQVIRQELPATRPLRTSSAGFVLGGGAGLDCTEGFQGHLDEVKIWEVPLSNIQLLRMAGR